MRLIDADTLQKRFFGEILMEVVDAEDIDNAPTIDAKPVVRGHWINEKVMVKGYKAKYCYDCSVCGKSTGYEYFPISNYCPSCGANMREEKE